MIFSKLFQFVHRTVNLITIGRKINMGSESGLASNKRLANARKMTNQRINTHARQHSARQNSAYPRTNWTQEGIAVMRSCITRYLKQWLRGAWIDVLLARDTHKSVRFGVSAAKFHWIVSGGGLYVLLCILDENRWSCTKSQGIACQGYCIVCFLFITL